MKVIAGLFDSELDASNAMDRLLQQNFKDMDTRVIEAGQNTNAEGPDVVLPFVPNTGNVGTGMDTSVGVAALGASRDWVDDLDGEVERAFYLEGMREGATLALARVQDEDAPRVRQLLRSYGARTYTEND